MAFLLTPVNSLEVLFAKKKGQPQSSVAKKLAFRRMGD
jgi:hypothetical protein